jgi:predicted TIM-barrel fold metal-dependent hydrolase
MPLDSVLVIDGDGHVMEPPDLYAKRMDAARWGDWVPHFDPSTGAFYVGGQVRSGGIEAIRRAAELSGQPFEKVRANFEKVNASLWRTGGFDPAARIADMDAAGIDVAVLYPSGAMFFGPVDPIPALHDPAFVRACQHAYNEWIAEFCSYAPERLFGIGLVPLQDVALAVEEARQVAELGLRGVLLRPSAYIDDLPLSHEVYEPFFAECEALDLVVAFHPGVHVDTPGACRKYGLVVEDADLIVVNNTVTRTVGGSGLGQAIGNAADMIVTVGRIVMGGVCERFPRLRFVFLESGGGWMPTILERMDEQVEEFPLDGANLSMLPSEYFRRQCYVSFEVDEWNLADAARFLGADRILWASDYPHPEYSEGVVARLAERLAGLDEASRRRIVGENAVDAYRLPIRAELAAKGT